MTNEIFIIQSILLGTTFLFTTALNLLVLWYLAGIYLLALGVLLFLNDGDIFVGFLWVIDLGVGLVFFIFILHYSVFLHQKSILNKNHRELWALIIFGLFLYNFYSHLLTPLDLTALHGFTKTWLFLINWIDYYLLYSIHTITDLNLLHMIYFVNNSFEFVLINFFLFYGIIGSILLSFLIKYMFTNLALPAFNNLNFGTQPTSVFFIRNQNFLKQQATSAGERVWVKTRFSKF